LTLPAFFGPIAFAEHDITPRLIVAKRVTYEKANQVESLAGKEQESQRHLG